MDLDIIGQMAAITTSCLWTFSSVLFSSAGRRIGSTSVNAYRIIIAVCLLAITHSLLLGSLLPVATSEQWFWMGMSGIIGLGIGDFGLFAAFVMVGPRRSVLIMTLSPIFASTFAYFMLNEIFSPLAMIGIVTTLTGVIMVVLEKEERSNEMPLPKMLKIWGSFLALIGAVGQGAGIVLAKKGIYLAPNMTLNPISATFMRMTIGALLIWVCALVAGRLPILRRALRDKQGIKHTIAGAFIAPFLGVTLSMIAVTYTQVGVAQTLMSLMPVLIIPVIWVFQRQKTSWRGILGASVAVVGVAILFLV